MTANLQGGKFNSLSVNSSNLHYLTFDFQGNLMTSNRSLTCNTKGAINLDANSNSRFKTLSGNLTFHTNDGRIEVDANSEEETAILLNTSNERGGITFSSGTNGIKQLSTGDISLISSGGNINIGLPDDDYNNLNLNNLTRNIQMEAVSTVSVNAEDFQVVVSDSLALISLSNNIVFGDSLSNPAIKISGGDVAIGTNVAGERRLTVAVDDSSTDKPDYDGILLKSLNDDVGPEIRLKNNNSESMLSLGIEANTSKHAINKEFMAFKKDNMIIKVGDNGYNEATFTQDDIGTQVYWTNEQIIDTIMSLSTYVSEPSQISNSDLIGTHTISISGTYTGTTTNHYVIMIDNIDLTPNTFKWSSDSGVTFSSRLVQTGSGISLGDGLEITFDETSGYNLHDYWTFTSTICGIANTSNNFATQNVYSLEPNLCYLMSETQSQLKIGTSNIGRLNITADGNIGINTSSPSATFEVRNKVNQIQLVNTQTTGNQLHPYSAGFSNGGYVVVWENDTDIYGQQFFADGSRQRGQFNINSDQTSNIQSFPHVAANVNRSYGGYMVVWSSEKPDAGTYDIRGQIYDEVTGVALKTFDIEINQSVSYNAKYPRVTSLSSGDYMVVWESDDNNTGNTNIYIQKVTHMGNLSGSEIQVNTVTPFGASYPFISYISDSDANIPGGFVVAYMNKTDADVNTDLYDVLYRIYDSNNNPQNAPYNVTSGTTSSYGRPYVVGLKDGGFALSYFRSYEADVVKFTIGEAVSTGLGLLYTTGVIAGYQAPNKLHITSVSPNGVFQIGNEILGSSSNHIEQIKSVSYTSTIFTLAVGDVELTMSDNLASLSYNLFDTSGGAPLSSITNVNTTPLVDYPAQLESNPTQFTRDNTVFDYKKPIPSMSQLYDGNVIIAWYNGLVPNIYTQKIKISDSSLLENEQHLETTIRKNIKGLKQINPSVTSVVSVDWKDMGYVVTWQNETLDFDMDGIFSVRFDDNYLISAGNNVWNVDNKGNMDMSGGISLNGNSPVIVLQNTNTDINSYGSDGRILFKNVDGNILGEIKACYAKSYNTPYPKSENLQLWYTFNETNSSITTDRSTNENTGILNNFAINHFGNGYDSKGIYFNGNNNYIDAGDNISVTNIGQSGFTITMWIKFPNVSTGTYELINNGITDVTGVYRMFINNNRVNGYLVTSNGLQSVTSIVSINTDVYTFVCFVANDDGDNKIYINGELDSSDTCTGTLAGYIDERVTIGVRDNANYYIGNMNDVRIYNTTLTSDEIYQMYNNITETKGQLILKTNNGSNVLSDTLSGLVIDDRGNVNNLHIKGDPIDSLSGSVSSSGTTVTGSNTLFLSELVIGDQMDINGNVVTVTKINSNTSLTIDRSLTASDSYPQRLPSIIVAKRENDGIKMIMTNEGKMGVGELNPSDILHISGDTPYINIESTINENINNGRLSGIKFRGIRDDTRHDLVKIEGSHIGSGNDNYGQFNLFTNNGLELTKTLSIDNNGRMGFGDDFTINNNITYEFRSRLDTVCNLVISNGIESANGLQERQSNLYFQNVEAAVPENDPENGSYAKIMGSADTNNTNIIGRLDLFTNNESSLVSYLSIKGNGNVGIGGIDEPLNPVHLSCVEYSTGTASQLGTTITGVLTDFTNIQIGSVIVFSNNKYGVVISVGGSSTMTVNTSQTVSTQNYKIYYPGMSLSSLGNVAVGTTVNYPAKCHVHGSFGMKVSTVTTSTTLDDSYGVVLCNNTSGSITISLPPAADSNGMTFIIKKIGTQNVVIDPFSTELIDGAGNVTITTAYDSRHVICNGVSWYII